MPDTSTGFSRLRKIASSYRGKVRAAAARSYGRLRYRLQWKYLANPVSRRHFASHPERLTPVQERAARELSARGIALVSGYEVGLDLAAWDELRLTVEEFARSDRVRERIGRYALEAQQRSLIGDDYLVKLHPEGPTLPSTDALLRLGLDGAILHIVNRYLGLWGKLIYTDVWHTIAIDIGRKVGSQSWHRDPEDRRMVKAYLYFAPVDEGAGPLQYVAGSALGGPYENLWRWGPRVGHRARYPNEAELERVVPRTAWVTCTGPEGTLVLADTCGLHRGGVSSTSPRILATWTFVTPAAIGTTAHRRFKVSPGSFAEPFSEAARFALE